MEFLELPLAGLALKPERLCGLFRTWDTLRFSGQDLEMADMFKAINDVSALVAALDKAEKEKHFKKPLAAQELASGGSL